MKMQIVDLMDLYVGEDAAELGDRLPPLPEIGQQRGKPSVPMKKSPRFRKTLGLAASILIVLGIAGALFLGLGSGKTGDNTLSPGEEPPAVTQWGTVPSESPSSEESSEMTPEVSPAGQTEHTTIPSTAPAENTDVLLTPDIMPQLTASAQAEDNWNCEGNLLYAGGQYYTAVDGEIQPVEPTTVHIDFYAYGDWDFYIDYIHDQDGNLALRDRSENDIYFRVTRWPGSRDTVKVSIRRVEKGITDNSNYPVFYHLDTGELSDPLANVPELYDHGNVSDVQVSDDLRWGLAAIYSNGFFEYYLCNLESGEMVALSDCLTPYYPSEIPENEIQFSSVFWGIDGTLYAWIYGSGSDGTFKEWLMAYEPDTDTLRYCRDSTSNAGGGMDYGREFVHTFEASACVITACADGSQWTLDGIKTEKLGGSNWDETDQRMVFQGDDGNLYLIDDTTLSWVNLSHFLSLPEDEIISVMLPDNDFLCVYTQNGVYGYVIPDDLPSETLTLLNTP